MNPLNEITLMNRQLTTNNNNIHRLLSITERLQRENTTILNRINGIQRDMQRRQRYEPLREETNLRTEDVLYFYFPRREELRLSQSTIDRETSRHIFQEIEGPNNLSCPICLEVFDCSQEVTMINHCKHLFNSAQLTTWFETNTTCPVCRHDIGVAREPLVPPPANANSGELLGNIATQILNNDSVNNILNSFDTDIVNIINRFR